MSNDVVHADMNYLDDYIEAFYYENIEAKVEASHKILLLSLDYNNLEFMLNHDSLMGTLSRTLQDEHKKSLEMSIAILSTFYYLSNYEEFHDLLMNNKTGDTTMKIIEYQIQRFDLRINEYHAKERAVQALQREPAKLQEAQSQLDKELKKLNKLINKQDKLFYIAFNILLNLANDLKTEKKMTKRNIIGFLVRMLERNNGNLIVLALYFLKKLSIISDCKDQMLKNGIIERMPRFFKNQNPAFVNLALRLLINLSFDNAAKVAVKEKGIIPYIVDMLKINELRLLALIELYLLSYNDKIRNDLAITDLPILVYQLIHNFPQPIVGRELSALAINMCTNKIFINNLGETDQIDSLIKRAFKFGDILLFKMIRNISQFNENAEVQDLFKAYGPEIIKLALSDNVNEDLKVELVGIMTNIDLGAEWIDVLKNSKLEDFLYESLSIGYSEDDLILETVCLLAKMVENDKTATYIADSRLLNSLLESYFEKSDDEEFLNQYLFIFYRFLFLELAVEEILNDDRMVDITIECLGHTNARVRKIADDVCGIVMEYDAEFAERIKEKKFTFHNQEWIQSVEEFDELKWQQYMDDMRDRYGDEEEDEYGHAMDPRFWEMESDYLEGEAY